LTLKEKLDFNIALDSLRQFDRVIEWIEPNYYVERSGVRSVRSAGAYEQPGVESTGLSRLPSEQPVVQSTGLSRLTSEQPGVESTGLSRLPSSRKAKTRLKSVLKTPAPQGALSDHLEPVRLAKRKPLAMLQTSGKFPNSIHSYTD